MIKIISGTYGLRKGNRVIPKNSKSEPFETNPSEEKRLIDLGIAEEVKVNVLNTEPEDHPEEDISSNSFEDMSVKQLKKYAKEQNIIIPNSVTKKAGIIAVIMSAESENNDEKGADGTEPGNNVPNIQAQMPE